LTVAIEPTADAALAEWLRVWNRAHPYVRRLDAMRFDDAMRPEGERFLRLSATDDGRLVGIAEAALSESGVRFKEEAEAFVCVTPEARNRGLGRRLAEAVLDFVREARVSRVNVPVLDRELPLAEPLLKALGFHELERYLRSVQDPRSVDTGRLADLEQRLLDYGIRCLAFVEIDSPVWRRELWSTTNAIEHDQPSAGGDWEDPSLEDFEKRFFERPGVIRDALFVAVDGDRLVGLTVLVEIPEGELDVDDTGVLSSYRRRGIARVLKLMATRWAAERGISRVTTENNITNVGMLALNRELGFRPVEQIIHFEKRL
jgi:GNAT superfamily N-acetyltransferase